MAKIDILIQQAKRRIKVSPGDQYEFSKLTTEELKELAYGDPTEERFNELVNKIHIDRSADHGKHK